MQYQKLITTKGFGYSGSGTLIDFFSEFDNTTVIGFHDRNGSLYRNNGTQQNIEVNFLRGAGGVFDLEKAFEGRWPPSREILLKIFITMTEHLHLRHPKFYNDEYMKLTREFLNRLISFQMKVPYYALEHPYLAFEDKQENENLEQPFIKSKDPNHLYNRYFLKNLTKEEYRIIAKDYVKKILELIDSKEYLIIDQFANNMDTDYKRKSEFLDYKEVAVYRDPRDVYATGRIMNNQWIPENKELFVKWYLYIHKDFLELQYPNFLLLRFEHFVNNYQETKNKILKFLDMSKVNHIKERQYFNPDISRKNIGIYKQLQNQNAIEYIEKNLKEYCYYGETNA